MKRDKYMSNNNYPSNLRLGSARSKSYNLNQSRLVDFGEDKISDLNIVKPSDHEKPNQKPKL